ncbi:MAG: glycosyltransferase [Oscillospiraceae bacterium]|jgi:hypothetical protein|nr:glycosyltransferase [Oscillospiraceae bacterium]
MLKITINKLTTTKTIIQEYTSRFLAEPESDVLIVSDDIVLHESALDSLKSCLKTAEKHAISVGYEIENNKNLIKTAWKYLPEYTITINVNVDCVLIKRSVIDKLGFFDEAFTSLHWALLDFYCRINMYGFSALAVYHAMYSYKDDIGDNNKFSNDETNADEELFLSRYEHYWNKKTERFGLYNKNPCVEFLKLIDEKYYPKKKILFDCIALTPQYNGTSEYLRSYYDAFYRLFSDKYDIYLYVTHEVDEFFEFSKKYINVLYPETLDGEFHLGFSPNQLMFYEQQVTLNKHCLKIVQSILDIIALRIDEHVSVDGIGDIELGILLSDGIVFISDFAVNDFKAYFSSVAILNNMKKLKQKRIYLTSKLDEPKMEYDLPFDKYFLIVGNSYKHKALNETISAVVDTQENFIVIGLGENDYIKPNIYGYQSGFLDDDFISYLYANCTAVIFPSLYEGFGLPITICLKLNKIIIVNNNDLNKELREHYYDFKRYIITYDNFDDIRDIINKTDFSTTLASVEFIDTWDRAATELESFFAELLNTKVDLIKLNERYHMDILLSAGVNDRLDVCMTGLKAEISHLNHQIELHLIENTRLYNETKELIVEKGNLLNEKHELTIERDEVIIEKDVLSLTLNHLYSRFNEYKLFSLMRFSLIENLKHRHPKLYRLLSRE